MSLRMRPTSAWILVGALLLWTCLQCGVSYGRGGGHGGGGHGGGGHSGGHSSGGHSSGGKGGRGSHGGEEGGGSHSGEESGGYSGWGHSYSGGHWSSSHSYNSYGSSSPSDETWVYIVFGTLVGGAVLWRAWQWWTDTRAAAEPPLALEEGPPPADYAATHVTWCSLCGADVAYNQPVCPKCGTKNANYRGG